MSRLSLAGITCAWLVVACWGGGRSKGTPPAEDALIRDLKFVKVPRGTFWMGWDSQKKQSNQVEIKQDFELAAYCVTQGQWEAVMGSNPSWFSRNGKGSKEVQDVTDAELRRFPVEDVAWIDVQEFLKKLNTREQGKGYSYRLPKQAEWEYACRNAAKTKEECSFDFYFAKPTNDLSSTQANFSGDKPAGGGEKGPYLARPTKVGSYAPNQLGLYDMHGNVWQWCDDVWDATTPDRGFRGGSWGEPGPTCRAAHRAYAPAIFEQSPKNYDIGFRLARVPSAGKP